MFQHNQSTIKNKVLTWNRDLTGWREFHYSTISLFHLSTKKHTCAKWRCMVSCAAFG